MRDALLLPAGKLTRMMIFSTTQSDRRERRLPFRATARAVTRHAVEQRQLDVLERGGAREQIETLEDETEILIPNVGALITIELRTSAPSRKY